MLEPPDYGPLFNLTLATLGLASSPTRRFCPR
jgi:hypothetical protein